MVLACLSMIVAFGALWFASEGLRRMEIQNEHLINSHIKSLRATLGEYVNLVNSIDRRLQVVEKHVHSYKENHARTKETLLALEKLTRGMRAAEADGGTDRDVA